LYNLLFEEEPDGTTIIQNKWLFGPTNCTKQPGTKMFVDMDFHYLCQVGKQTGFYLLNFIAFTESYLTQEWTNKNVPLDFFAIQNITQFQNLYARNARYVWSENKCYACVPPNPNLWEDDQSQDRVTQVFVFDLDEQNVAEMNYSKIGIIQDMRVENDALFVCAVNSDDTFMHAWHKFTFGYLF
jgi:hypothetical protein